MIDNQQHNPIQLKSQLQYEHANNAIENKFIT